MSAAGNGSGSHFASSRRGKSQDDFSTGAASYSSPTPPSDRLEGDTAIFAAIGATPNGSQASGPMQRAAARPASPSDTDAFMAVIGGAATPGQPSLSPSERPIGSPAPAAAAATAASAAPASDGPVNPLVAAQKANSTGGAAALYPIEESAAAGDGGSFDMSFSEKGSKKGIVILIVVLLVVAGLFVGGFFGLRAKQAADARDQISEAFELLRTTDEVIVPLDAAIASEVETGVSSDALSNLMLLSSDTNTKLSEAEKLADRALSVSSALGQEDIDAANAVKASVSARRGIITAGNDLLSVDSAHDDALNGLAMAYGANADAKSKMQQDLDIYLSYLDALAQEWDTSGYDLWSIVQLDQDAAAQIASAQQWTAEAVAAFPEMDASAFQAYLDARAAQIEMLIQIDTFIANGDTDSADALSEQYATLEAAANDAETRVPATAAEMLLSAYTAQTSAMGDDYEATRQKAVAADATLNSYMGITDKSKTVGLSASDSSSNKQVSASVSDQTAVDGTAAGEGEAAEGATAEGDVASPAEGDAAGDVVPEEGGEAAPEEGEAPVEEVPEAA